MKPAECYWVNYVEGFKFVLAATPDEFLLLSGAPKLMHTIEGSLDDAAVPDKLMKQAVRIPKSGVQSIYINQDKKVVWVVGTNHLGKPAKIGFAHPEAYEITQTLAMLTWGEVNSEELKLTNNEILKPSLFGSGFVTFFAGMMCVAKLILKPDDLNFRKEELVYGIVNLLGYTGIMLLWLSALTIIALYTAIRFKTRPTKTVYTAPKGS